MPKKTETAVQRFERALRRALSTPATAPLSGVKARKKKRKAAKKKSR